MSDLLVCQLGCVPYADALALQEDLRQARLAGQIADVLLLLEHPPVITRGRRSSDDELPFGEAFLRDRGIDVVTTQRGGLATYHGPGMLVGYPIVGGITDVVGYLRALERALVAALARHGVEAYQRESTPEQNLTGVWVGDHGNPRKIASLGVHLSRGVAIHGFAVGADNDLGPWDWFTACGLQAVTMTSIGAETGRTDTITPLRATIGNDVAAALSLTARAITERQLHDLLAAAPR